MYLAKNNSKIRPIIIGCIFLCCLQTYAQQFRNFETHLGDTTAKGIALVLANNEYKNSTNLAMAIDDGKTMVSALRNTGFDVEVGYNLDKDEMLESILQFASKLDSYNTAFIYYSGHGVQFEGKNYLLPSDAKPSKQPIILKNSSISVNDVFKVIDNPVIPKVVVMDACRENPFLNQIESSTKSVQGQGLAEIKATTNSMIVFATALNTVVSDDNQFTEIFSRNIEQGGCIERIVKKTRNDILSIDRNQLIFTNEALTGEVCFGNNDNPSPKPNPIIIPVNNKITGFIPKYSLEEWIKDYGIERLQKAANNGNIIAIRRLARIYDYGLGLDKNKNKAEYWYKKASKLGDKISQSNLGSLYKFHFDNYKEAHYWLEKASNQRNPKASYLLGLMYVYGEGVKKNHTKGQYYYEKADNDKIYAKNNNIDWE